MPYRRGTGGEKIPLSNEELEALYQRYINSSSDKPTARAIETALNAWKERLDLLKKRRNGKEVEKNINIEIRIKDILIFNALLGNPRAFCEWMKKIMTKDKYEAPRAYGYSIHLAKNLDVARKATSAERKQITDKKLSGGDESFVIFKGKVYVPCHETHRNVFYYLNILRINQTTRAPARQEPF